MRSSFIALALAVMVVLGGTAFYSLATQDGLRAATTTANPTPGGIEHVRITSFDGTELALTVFKPAGASAETPVPMVLNSHGWSGTRTTSLTGIVGRLVADGFGVLTFDARGHGESGGYAMVHHKDFEVKDTQAILDWMHANLDWAQKEPASGIPRDLVVGATGYSYGGGYQLQLATYDGRLDALAPEITWNFLPDALAPQGAVKSAWVDALYGLALQSGTRIDPRIHEWFRSIQITNHVPQEAYDHFVGSSPNPANITAPVLLIQGVPDVLFNLNQALATYDALTDSGNPDVRLFTHLTGHVVPVQPLGTGQDRRMPYETVGPCGDLEDLVAGWMDLHLRSGAEPGVPEVSLALDDGECLRLDARPRDHENVTLPAAVLPSAGGTVLLPLLEGPRVVAGIPHLRAAAPTLAAPGRAYASLVLVAPDGYARVLDDQTQPIPLVPGQPLDVDLVAVAARMHEGDQLFLRLDGLNEWYFHNSERAPGGALLTGLTVSVPTVDA